LQRLLSNTDFLTGILFMVLGGGFVLLARNYEFGSAVSMGPGFFPVFLGCGVVAIGLVLVGKALLRQQGGEEAAFHLRPGFFVLGAMLLFALLLRPMGLLVASAVLVVVSSLGSSEGRWKETAILALGLAVFSAVVFVQALGVPMNIWPRGF